MTVPLSSTSASTTVQDVGAVQDRHHSGHGGAMRKALEAVADKLCVTSDDLKSQMDSGRSLADVAAAKGVSRDDLLATVKAALQKSGGDRDGDGDGPRRPRGPRPPRPADAAAGSTTGTTATTSTTASTAADALDQLAAALIDRVGRNQRTLGATGTGDVMASGAQVTSIGGVAFRLPVAGGGGTYL